jgi:hypothetical protein
MAEAGQLLSRNVVKVIGRDLQSEDISLFESGVGSVPMFKLGKRKLAINLQKLRPQMGRWQQLPWN